MPAVEVYSVDFKRGNLDPDTDTQGWGPMVLGNSGAAANPTSSGDPQGLTLAVTGAGEAAGIGVHVVFDDGQLPLQTRLVSRVEFDRPDVVNGSPEPWVVALAAKLDEEFTANKRLAAVTCQFRQPGVRLNTPANLEGDPGAELITPLNYGALTPGIFTLKNYFCGVKAVGRQSIGFGSLSTSSQIGAKEDQRLYSTAEMSGGQEWIGALGVTIATITGQGRFTVRLRKFSVAMWGVTT